MANYKKLMVGESQIEALRNALAVRIVTLKHFEESLERRNEMTAKQNCFEQRCALVYLNDELSESPWIRIPE